ncbi:hypothetical protein T11_14797 [Trichinella zimbabwensis]|uniref:Uncharacterized protein n=1 Tax=Trichinella zimbabwensis TaxID=268475 RepID=A0A0V1I784_9BILA|nr:hypothetical protein T11_14797 [Trichinella zimbabwensis]
MTTLFLMTTTIRPLGHAIRFYQLENGIISTLRNVPRRHFTLLVPIDDLPSNVLKLTIIGVNEIKFCEIIKELTHQKGDAVIEILPTSTEQ